MAPPRRRGMKAKKSRRPRFYRRKAYRKVSSIKYLRVKESYDAGTFSANAGGSLNVSLNAIAGTQLSAYQALYAKYKITGAKFMFIPQYNSVGDMNQAYANIASGAGWTGQTRILVGTARGVAAAPANEITMLSRDHKLRMLVNKPINIYVKNPVFGVDANPGGVSTETKWDTGYLGTAQSPDVQHQGIEWYATSAGNTPAQFKVFITLYITLTEAQ